MRSSDEAFNRMMWDRYEKYPGVIYVFRFKRFGRYEYLLEGKTLSGGRYQYNPAQNSFYFKEGKRKDDYKVKWLSDTTVFLDGWNNGKIKITLEKME